MGRLSSMDRARNICSVVGDQRATSLLVSAASRTLAIPIAHVIETMRPLPIAPVPGAPRCVLGVSIVRGAPTPVIDLAAFATGELEHELGRLVTVRAGARTVALAVGGVIGVREVPAGEALPPLVADADALAAIGVLDAELLIVLETARLADAIAEVA